MGAERLVIYETDGMANQGSTPGNGFVSGSYYNSNYQIQPGQPLSSAGYSQTGLLQAVQNLCNDVNGNAVLGPGITPFTPNLNYPGFGVAGKPVTIHCLVFGGIFETPSFTLTSSVDLIQQISAVGGTVFPSTASDPTNGFKWCIGTIDQRQPPGAGVSNYYEHASRTNHSGTVTFRAVCADPDSKSISEPRYLYRGSFSYPALISAFGTRFPKSSSLPSRLVKRCIAEAAIRAGVV